MLPSRLTGNISDGIFSWLTGSEKNNYKRYKSAFLIFFFVNLIYFAAVPFTKWAGLIVLPLVFVLLLCSAFCVKRFLFITIAYTTILPTHYYYITFMPAYVSFNITTLLYGITVFFGIIQLIRNQNKALHLYAVDIILMGFLFIVITSAFYGHIRGNDAYFIRLELQFILMYSAYFLFVYGVGDINSVRHFYILLIAVTLIASFEFIIQAFIVNGFRFSRISTQQIHLAQVTIPFLVGLYYYSRSLKMKIACIVLMMPVFFLTLISLTRALWVGVVVSILFIMFQYRQKGHSKFKNFIKISVSLIMMSLIIFGLFTILKRSQGAQAEATMGERVQTFGDMQSDASLLIRYIEIGRIIEKTSDSPLLGLGLGASFLQDMKNFARFGKVNYVDNAFVWIYWKMGILGLFFFLLFLFYIFKRGYYCLKHLSDKDIRKLYVNSIMAGIIGLCLISLTNSSLINYRFDIIWAVMIASIEIIARQIEKESNESLP